MTSRPPSLLLFASFALLALFIGIAVLGVSLLRRRGAARLLGVVLLLEAVLALAAQVALSTIPFGIGEPLIRVRFGDTLLQAAIMLGALGIAGALVYFGSRFLRRQFARPHRRVLKVAGLVLLLPLLAPASLWAMTRVSLP